MPTYAIFRLMDDKPGCVDFCGTVEAPHLIAAEIEARRLWTTEPSERLSIEEEPEDQRTPAFGRCDCGHLESEDDAFRCDCGAILCRVCAERHQC